MVMYGWYTASEVIDVIDEGEYALLSLDKTNAEKVTGKKIPPVHDRLRVPSGFLAALTDGLAPYAGRHYSIVELPIPEGTLKIFQWNERELEFTILIERAKDHPLGEYSSLHITQNGVPTLVEKLRALARGEPSTGPVELTYPDPTSWRRKPQT